MAKSKQVKVQEEAPVAPAPVPVEVPAKSEKPAVKWARRLRRWQAKAEAQGVDARSLMRELADAA